MGYDESQQIADKNFLINSIACATYTALEDLGLNAEQAEVIIDFLSEFSAKADTAILQGLEDYKRKLVFCGGPKPRSI